MDPSDDDPPLKRRKVDGDGVPSIDSPLHLLNHSTSDPATHEGNEMEQLGVSANVLGETLQCMATNISTILVCAKKRIAESVESFANSCGPVLVKIFEIYESNFKSLGISSKSDLEQLCSSNFKHEIVRNGFEDLVEVEDEWDKVLLDVDHRLNLDAKLKGLKVNDTIPDDLEMYRVNDDTKSKIEEVGGHIVVVSLADPAGAQGWMSQMNCTFDFLLDRNRKLYKAIGLGRSIAQVWSIETVTWYAEQHVRGRPSYRPSRDDDIHQLGGDLLVGSDGRVLMVHAGTSPLDRPDIATLINLMKTDHERHEKSQNNVHS